VVGDGTAAGELNSCDWSGGGGGGKATGNRVSSDFTRAMEIYARVSLRQYGPRALDRDLAVQNGSGTL
jgi:hypothetical protein